MGRSVNRPALRSLALSYRKAIQDLVATGKYDSRDDFTVVIQPFFSRLTVPQTAVCLVVFSLFCNIDNL